MENTPLIEPIQVMAHLVCFLGLLFLLRKYVWGHFLKILDDRRDHITGELKQIADTKNEVAALKQDFEGKLTNIESIAAGKMKEAIAHGREAAEEVRDRARQEAQRIVGEAKMEIEQTVTKTKDELRRQVVELTILATEKMLEEKITEEQDRQLAKKFVTELEKPDAN